MEFLQVFLYVIGGFSIISLTDVSDKRYLNLSKMIFTNLGEHVIDMILNLDSNQLLIVKGNINNLSNVPINFNSREACFKNIERELFDVYSEFLDYYDYIFTLNDSMPITISIREDKEKITGSIFTMDNGWIRDITLNINKKQLVTNYNKYIKIIKDKILYYKIPSEKLLQNVFREYDLVSNN